MKSKIYRLDSAISNMEFAIKYYLTDIEEKNIKKEVSKREYERTVRLLKDIALILRALKIETSVSIKRIEEIRVLNLGIYNFYEEDDYANIFGEIIKTNNELCKEDKAKDHTRLSNLKKAFNELTPFYQYRLRKAVSGPDGLSFLDKKHDNFLFVTENYLNIKYNFKKIPYDVVNISSVNQERIEIFNKLIAASEIDDSIKKTCMDIRGYINGYAEAEVVIDNLIKTKELCVDKEYQNIAMQADILIAKYREKYNMYKEKYDNEVQKINNSNLENGFSR